MPNYATVSTKYLQKLQYLLFIVCKILVIMTGLITNDFLVLDLNGKGSHSSCEKATNRMESNHTDYSKAHITIYMRYKRKISFSLKWIFA